VNVLLASDYSTLGDAQISLPCRHVRPHLSPTRDDPVRVTCPPAKETLRPTSPRRSSVAAADIRSRAVLPSITASRLAVMTFPPIAPFLLRSTVSVPVIKSRATWPETIIVCAAPKTLPPTVPVISTRRANTNDVSLRLCRCSQWNIATRQSGPPLIVPGEFPCSWGLGVRSGQHSVIHGIRRRNRRPWGPFRRSTGQ
jgi:hypothetical protein